MKREGKVTVPAARLIETAPSSRFLITIAPNPGQKAPTPRKIITDKQLDLRFHPV